MSIRLDRRTFLAAAASSVAVTLGGCTPPQRYVRTIPPPEEIPVVNLPRALREWNWGGGSCVHASTVMILRWLGQEKLAAWWRKTYRGGETAYGLRRKMDASNIEYIDSTNDYWRRPEDHLEWASRTRRGAVIFFYPVHSIAFVGYATVDGKQYAIVLDNNRIDNFIRIEKRQFIREWHGYGSFALTPLGYTNGPSFAPTPPLPYHPLRPAG